MEEYIVNVNEKAIEKQRRELEENKKQPHDKKFVFNEKNYLNVRLNKGETNKTITIRILPTSLTDTNIFTIVKTHTLKVDKEISKSGFKQFICLNDAHIKNETGCKCPLCDKSNEYFNACNTATDSEEKKTLARMGFSYKPKDTFIIRVIERGKEDEGVKFWKFNSHNDGTGVYDKLMNIYDQRMRESIEITGKPYSIFDLREGRDIKINLNYIETTGRTTIDIIEAGFPSALSNDVKKANEWLSDTKTWRDVYAIKTYDYLSVIGDGGVPIYNTETNTFVAKSKEDNGNGPDKAAKPANELRNVPGSAGGNMTDDLPF